MRGHDLPADRILFDSGTGLRVGAFRRYPWQEPFADTGPIQGHLLVFPRTSVVIQHADQEPVVADPTRVMVYNRGQEYRRQALSDRGDECEWFAFPPELIAEALRDRDPAVMDHLDRPFSITHASVDASTYLLQRQVVEHLDREGDAPLESAFIEEAMMLVLERCLRSHPGREGVAPARSAVRHRELAEACRARLGLALDEPLSLRALADEVGASPFHLARVFRRQVGLSIHAYRQGLRLLTALESVTSGEDLARVAVDFGYAHHSHFTAAFRRAFGSTPSALRDRIRAGF